MRLAGARSFACSAWVESSTTCLRRQPSSRRCRLLSIEREFVGSGALEPIEISCLSVSNVGAVEPDNGRLLLYGCCWFRTYGVSFFFCHYWFSRAYWWLVFSRDGRLEHRLYLVWVERKLCSRRSDWRHSTVHCSMFHHINHTKTQQHTTQYIKSFIHTSCTCNLSYAY